MISLSVLIAQRLPRGIFFAKSFLEMCLYSQIYDVISLFRNRCEQKHRLPDTYYISNDRANVIKLMEVTSNSTQCKKRRNTKN